ncbi:hypothetical protein QL285_051339 [Trifolium repens]|nr:hypothetical protein QL285_051339 [Trifolium repens]
MKQLTFKSFICILPKCIWKQTSSDSSKPRVQMVTIDFSFTLNIIIIAIENKKLSKRKQSKTFEQKVEEKPSIQSYPIRYTSKINNSTIMIYLH